jgi:hypothetical protein
VRLADELQVAEDVRLARRHVPTGVRKRGVHRIRAKLCTPQQERVGAIGAGYRGLGFRV